MAWEKHKASWVRNSSVGTDGVDLEKVSLEELQRLPNPFLLVWRLLHLGLVMKSSDA